MMESRLCIKCREEINPLRLKALPSAKTCVDCSTTGAKRGVPMMFGEKDHTWTDMVIMEADEFDKFEKASKQPIQQLTCSSQTKSKPSSKNSLATNPKGMPTSQGIQVHITIQATTN